MSKILILNVYILFYRNSRKKQYVVWERSFNFWHNWGSIFRYLYLGYNVCKNYNETIAWLLFCFLKLLSHKITYFLKIIQNVLFFTDDCRFGSGNFKGNKWNISEIHKIYNECRFWIHSDSNYGLMYFLKNLLRVSI